MKNIQFALLGYRLAYIMSKSGHWCTYADSINIRLDVTHQSIDGIVYVGFCCWIATQHILMHKLLQRLTKVLKWSWHAEKYHREISKHHVSGNDVKQIGEQSC